MNQAALNKYRQAVLKGEGIKIMGRCERAEINKKEIMSGMRLIKLRRKMFPINLMEDRIISIKNGMMEI